MPRKKAKPPASTGRPRTIKKPNAVLDLHVSVRASDSRIVCKCGKKTWKMRNASRIREHLEKCPALTRAEQLVVAASSQKRKREHDQDLLFRSKMVRQKNSNLQLDSSSNSASEITSSSGASRLGSAST